MELEAKYCLEAEKGSGLREDGKTAYKISNVFGFFVSHLEQTQYLDQTEKRGVQVYPYRAAAASPFKVHVVVDASQDSLSVGSLFKQLDFLNEAKRDVILKIDPSTNDKFFKFSDFDPSESFISLYQLSSEKASYFTSAEHSVEKYGFPHGFLKNEDRIEPEKSGNIFSSERFSFVEKTAEYPAVIMKSQKVGFDSWKERVLASEKEMGLSRWDESKEKVREIIEKKYRSKAGGKFKISPSNVKAFYKCPRQWLFERILSLKPLNNEADLMNDFVVGRINHAVFEEYLGVLKSRGLSFSRPSKKSRTGLTYCFPNIHTQNRIQFMTESIIDNNYRFVKEVTDNTDWLSIEETDYCIALAYKHKRSTLNTYLMHYRVVHSDYMLEYTE